MDESAKHARFQNIPIAYLNSLHACRVAIVILIHPKSKHGDVASYAIFNRQSANSDASRMGMHAPESKRNFDESVRAVSRSVSVMAAPRELVSLDQPS